MRLKSNLNAAAATKVAGLEKEGRAPMCDALLEHPSLFPPPHLSLKKCIETPFATYSGRMHAMLQKRRAAYFLSIYSAQRRRVRAATRWAFECAPGTSIICRPNERNIFRSQSATKPGSAIAKSNCLPNL